MHFFKAWGKRNLLSRLGTNLVIQSRLVFLLLHFFYGALFYATRYTIVCGVLAGKSLCLLLQNANQREAAIGFVLNLPYDFCMIFEFQFRNTYLSY
jgi:hypothetical protein